jgi:hypothetical protein
MRKLTSSLDEERPGNRLGIAWIAQRASRARVCPSPRTLGRKRQRGSARIERRRTIGLQRKKL